MTTQIKATLANLINKTYLLTLSIVTRIFLLISIVFNFIIPGDLTIEVEEDPDTLTRYWFEIPSCVTFGVHAATELEAWYKIKKNLESWQGIVLNKETEELENTTEFSSVELELDGLLDTGVKLDIESSEILLVAKSEKGIVTCLIDEEEEE